MAAGAIRRKDLKRDEFVSTAAKVGRWLVQRKRRLGWTLLVVAVLVSVVAGVRLYQQRQDERASALLATALDLYNAPVVAATPVDSTEEGAAPSAAGTAAPETAGADEHGPAGHRHFPTERAKFEAARDALLPIATDYGSRAAGRVAAFYLGLCEAELGNSEEAVRWLESAAAASQPLIAALAAYRLGYLYLEQGRPEDAVARFDEMLAGDDGVFPREEALIGKGRAHEAAGDPRAALATYQRVVDEHGGTFAAVDARARVEVISAQLGLDPDVGQL